MSSTSNDTLPVTADRAGPHEHSRRADTHLPRATPWWLMLPAVLAVVFLVAPLAALLIRTPWQSLPTALADPAIRQALWLSLWTATVATLVAVLLGVPLAWVLARAQFPGRNVVRACVTLPLVLPPVVAGVALLTLLGRGGLLGARLNAWFGVSVGFTPAAVILAQTFVSMPFLVIAVEGALRTSGDRYEEAAATLGARPLTSFRRVTLPGVAAGIGAGIALCWARALGEFGATITFAGSFPGRTRTMPSAVYSALETDPQAAVALSLVMLLVCGVVLVALRRRWWPRP